MWDIVLEYRHAAVHDLQLRVLSASLSSLLEIKNPFLRDIEQSGDLQEIKAHWNRPEVSVKEGQIELSAEVSGGLRQVTTGRILTLDGPVSVKQNPTLASDTHGRPYTCVDTPSPQTLNMRELKVTYEGSKWAPLQAKLSPAKAEKSLRPVITTQLFEQLASIPLTYMPSSLPIAMSTSWRTATKTLRVIRALPRTLERSGAVALGLMLDKTQVPASTLVSLLPEDAEYNAAIGISTAGLNTLLAHCCEQDRAMGQFYHSQLGWTGWQWEQLTVTLLDETIFIEGVLLQQGVRTWAQARIQCNLDENGTVQCRLLSSNTDALVAETLLVSWNELLKTLLNAPSARKQNTESGERLIQLIEIPTTT